LWEKPVYEDDFSADEESDSCGSVYEEVIERKILNKKDFLTGFHKFTSEFDDEIY
jgi:hypothetical protein